MGEAPGRAGVPDSDQATGAGRLVEYAAAQAAGKPRDWVE